jgi:ribosome maturation factor RimP
MVINLAPLLAAGALISGVTPRMGARTTAIRACKTIDALDGPFWDLFRSEAGEIGASLGLEIQSIEMKSGTLRVLASGGGVDELQQLNSELSGLFDRHADDETVEALPPFMLNVSSPGLSNVLESDRDFTTFKGFPVTITMTEEFKKKTVWEGTLTSRDEDAVLINVKGRPVKIPRELIAEVRLPDAKREAGDTFF